MAVHAGDAGIEAAERSRRRLLLFLWLTVPFGIGAAIIGFLMDEPMMLAASAALLAGAYLAQDVAGWRHHSLSPMSLYAAAGIAGSIANVVAIYHQDSPSRSQYFIYAIDAHLPLAMKVAWFGLLAPLVGFRAMRSSATGRAICTLVPVIYGRVSRRNLLPLAMSIGVIGILAKMYEVLPSLGTLTGILYYLPHLAAFILAHGGMLQRRPAMIWMGLAVAVAEGTRALLFAYLRSDVISPIFAYAIGLLIGARSLRAAATIYMAPVYAVATLAVVFFAAFGDVRQESGGGVERIEAVAAARLDPASVPVAPRHALLTRLSSINQLTQIVRIVEEDGFLQGETLEYLAYAWIPRFIWPEKPTIAKGSWFALRIGQARVFEGRITNAVNMTVPGELYLNYSWLGLILGSLIFGAIFAVFWRSSGALRDPDNVIGAAFAMYLFWIGFGGGADLQIIVTLVATYLVFLAASYLFPSDSAVHGRAPLAYARVDRTR